MILISQHIEKIAEMAAKPKKKIFLSQQGKYSCKMGLGWWTLWGQYEPTKNFLE